MDRSVLHGQGGELLDQHAGKLALGTGLVATLTFALLWSSLSTVGIVWVGAAFFCSVMNLLFLRLVPEFSKNPHNASSNDQALLRAKKMILLFFISMIVCFGVLCGLGMAAGLSPWQEASAEIGGSSRGVQELMVSNGEAAEQTEAGIFTNEEDQPRRLVIVDGHGGEARSGDEMLAAEIESGADAGGVIHRTNNGGDMVDDSSQWANMPPGGSIPDSGTESINQASSFGSVNGSSRKGPLGSLYAELQQRASEGEAAGSDAPESFEASIVQDAGHVHEQTSPGMEASIVQDEGHMHTTTQAGYQASIVQDEGHAHESSNVGMEASIVQDAEHEHGSSNSASSNTEQVNQESASNDDLSSSPYVLEASIMQDEGHIHESAPSSPAESVLDSPGSKPVEIEQAPQSLEGGIIQDQEHHHGSMMNAEAGIVQDSNHQHGQLQSYDAQIVQDQGHVHETTQSGLEASIMQDEGHEHVSTSRMELSPAQQAALADAGSYGMEASIIQDADHVHLPSSQSTEGASESERLAAGIIQDANHVHLNNEASPTAEPAASSPLMSNELRASVMQDEGHQHGRGGRPAVYGYANNDGNSNSNTQSTPTNMDQSDAQPQPFEASIVQDAGHVHERTSPGMEASIVQDEAHVHTNTQVGYEASIVQDERHVHLPSANPAVESSDQAVPIHDGSFGSSFELEQAQAEASTDSQSNSPYRRHGRLEQMMALANTQRMKSR